MSHSQNNSRQRELIVDKLNSALAVIRRERDELHRSKELAVERLRLAREERQAFQKTVRSMEEKLKELNDAVSTGKNDKSELLRLQKEVEQLGKEAKFQHAELVGKREKLSRLEAKIADDTKVQATSLRSAREAVRKRRDATAIMNDADFEKDIDLELCPEKSDNIKRFFAEIDNDDLLAKWPRLIEEKASMVAMEAADVQRENNGLKRRISGYKRYVDSSASFVMPTPVTQMGQ
eukprot:CAMPEP_0172496176 /NCGR_PEP_ID=MMETSP1066-20121228/82865_1 /TAXON_ID=671091 /ORGANISM="Coscinodiscus wailesii, Strain CCMP2513" /LENGTH=234 /DNA_ID=CAMNT_0013268335 /DNA_START=65 /DNA_END=769 /DNA_ORIENTATION=+